MASLVTDLSTPSLLVEKARLDANLAAQQERANQQGVRLRPHIKTHKSPDLARRQTAQGAHGLTVATVDEASAFAHAGFDNLTVAREVVDPRALGRLADLVERGVELTFCVDTIAGVEKAAKVFGQRGLTAQALVEVDVGHGRCGVARDGNEAERLLAFLQSQSAIVVRGLLTHGGQGYFGPRDEETPVEALDRAMREERDRLLALAARLGAQQLLDPSEGILSLGATPTFSRFENSEQDGWRITEARPGNYVFHDAMQVALGVCAPASCALTVQATVLSIHRDSDGTDRVYIDAGKKMLTTDTGYGTEGYGVLLHSPRTMKPLPHARLHSLSEEHGWIEIPGGSTFEVGDRVRIVPNHACVVVANARALYLVEGDEVIDEWETVAR